MGKEFAPVGNIPPELITYLPFAGGNAVTHSREPFVKGPIPVWWLQLASCECGTSAVAIGLILFFRQGLGSSVKPVTKTEAEKWGMCRNTKDAVLKKLVQARLVKLEQYGHRTAPVLDLVSRKGERAVGSVS